MATNFTVSVDEVSCPVCFNIFDNPVLLPCSHSLCKECLQQCRRSGSQNCPLCRRVCPPDTNPPINLALKNLCERFHLEQEAGGGGGSQTLCSLHNEKLKLFCLVDKQPICVDCVPNLHAGHKCCHIKMAVEDHKLKVQSALRPLKKKLESLRQIRKSKDTKKQYIKTQVQYTEQQIKQQFQKLHQFLDHEEKRRITALRVEEKQRDFTLGRTLDKTSKIMDELLITIAAIEQEMERDDTLFLQNFNATMKRAQCTVEVPDVSKVLIDVAKHLGNLKFQVWEKMLGMVQYTPVILDPNRASPSLLLSEDLTSIQEIKNREHYESEWPILGSQGFSSGKHQWDVEINRDTIIDIGITKEPPELRSTLNTISSKCCYERLTGVCGGLPKKSELQGKNKIRVLLDCDQNIVSFFDIYGKKTLSTNKYTFSGKVFPFFNLMCLPPEPLKIVPAKVKVTVQ